ncbi:hypothetical protein ECC02_010409 [Trypanosoma cruzi]|uniref:Uncharacterized protein n=1 Tax=Trypanosoma cruzi TaxID=5693 RepID=A0A7J6XQH6_TRYCR|nr:hypothetical protein ECC02_010409 [Trypanosoma cruzi]
MKKKSSITVPHKFKNRLAAVWPHQTVCIYFAHKRKLKRWLRVFQPSDPPCVRTSFIFHGVICVLLLPSALSSACECGPQSTVTRVCGDWEKHADMTGVASLHRESERSKRKKNHQEGREMLTGLPAREMNTKSKKKNTAAGCGCVCVALRVSARPGHKENKTRGKEMCAPPHRPSSHAHTSRLPQRAVRRGPSSCVQQARRTGPSS